MICLKGMSFIKNIQRRGKGLSLQSCWGDGDRGAKSFNLKIYKNNVIIFFLISKEIRGRRSGLEIGFITHTKLYFVSDIRTLDRNIL